MPPKRPKGFPTLIGQTDENRTGEAAVTTVRFDFRREAALSSRSSAQIVLSARAVRGSARSASYVFGGPAPVSAAPLALTWALFAVAAGCSGQSRFLTGGPTVGQLKTSLSNVEYENQQLKRASAKLQQENRAMEDRLVQEEIDNGDLAARLDDARNLLRDRGLDPDVRVGSHRGRGGLGSSAADMDGSSTISPSIGPVRPRRKPPFAQISGPTDPVPPMQQDDDPAPQPRGRRDMRSRRPDDVDHQAFYDGPLRWVPVAEATGASATGLR
jgi:hypothetical protein